MRTIAKSIFTFAELSDTAKEKAREWYRQDLDVDYEHIFDDAANIADILGLDIRQTRIERMNGKVYYAPSVYFSGFWSQGDGACFGGHYRYKKGWKKALKAFCNDDELMRIGQALQDLQKKHFYRLGASITHQGRYYHEYSMGVDCEHLDGIYQDLSSAEKEFREIFADFAQWIYKGLRDEYDCANSNEAIDDALELGEFEFYENGDIFKD